MKNPKKVFDVAMGNRIFFLNPDLPTTGLVILKRLDPNEVHYDFESTLESGFNLDHLSLHLDDDQPK